MMDVQLMLADHAEVVNGKHYIHGGGWTVTNGDVPFAIAVTAQIPWDEAGVTHELTLEVVDEDGGPALVNGQQFRIPGQIKAERPEGALPGTSLDARLAINVSPVPFVKGKRYRLIARCGDQVLDGKGFSVRAA